MRTRRLIVASSEGERELLFIGRLTVGRAPECDISLADNKASRRHAEFDGSGPVPRVTDLGSRNGILVNGRKVGGADLSPGDVVTVGDALIRFEEHTSSAPDEHRAASSSDDRTAILPPAVLAMPPAVAPVAATPAAEPVPPLAMSSDPEKTSILTPLAVRSPATSERTTVLPPPAPGPARAQPVAAPNDGRAAAIAPPPVLATAPVPAPPPPVPAAPGAAAATPAVPTVAAAPPRAPRFSWAGLLTILCILLGGVGVLLGALPLLSATAATLDALSTRQARTLGGWLSTAVNPQGVMDERVVDAVSSQPGVLNAVLLDRGTRRAIAPRRMIGRLFPEVPSAGAAWPELASAQVIANGDVIDALVPVTGGTAGYLAWVRYERPSGREGGMAVVVALLSTLMLAMLVSTLIKRKTAATMQHFTRQVELAVSGADPKVMQGNAVPGLERLPGVVAYLLEQRTTSAAAKAGGGAHAAAPPASVAAPLAESPAWLEVTPSLVIVATSARAPLTGTSQWDAAASKHLLDVLQDAGLRNAVVQGLGALGMQAGAEVAVPVPDQQGASVGLRREASGNVRVTLGTR